MEPQQGLGWKDLKAHSIPPPAVGKDTFHETTMLQPGPERFQGWEHGSLLGCSGQTPPLEAALEERGFAFLI